MIRILVFSPILPTHVLLSTLLSDRCLLFTFFPTSLFFSVFVFRFFIFSNTLYFSFYLLIFLLLSFLFFCFTSPLHLFVSLSSFPCFLLLFSPLRPPPSLFFILLPSSSPFFPLPPLYPSPSPSSSSPSISLLPSPIPLFLPPPPLNRSEDEAMEAGGKTMRILVPHPAISEVTGVQLRYTAYKGWIYSGFSRWAIDQIVLMDSFGKT